MFKLHIHKNVKKAPSAELQSDHGSELIFNFNFSRFGRPHRVVEIYHR